MADDRPEYWIDDVGVQLLLDTRKRRGEQVIQSFQVDEDGYLIIVSMGARRTKSSTIIAPGHWWDHPPTDEELALDPVSETPDKKNR